MTAHERLTAPNLHAVVLAHAKPACALAAATNPQGAFAITAPASPSPKSASEHPDSFTASSRQPSEPSSAD